MSLYADVVRYPDLFLSIFQRELYGKYRGSVLGLFWTLVNPLVLMGVYTLVFSVLLKAFQIEHYPLFVLSGLVTWVFFQSAVQMSCSSLFAQPTLVKQIKFPRHILPLAVVATNIVTLVAMLAVVVFFNLIFIPETRTTFWVAIPLLVPLIALASGLGVVFGYLTVVYRDIEHLMTTVFLPWFFITPIFFTLDQLPGLEGNECGRGRPLLRELRRPVRRGDPGSALLRRVAPSSGMSSTSWSPVSSALALGVVAARRIDDQVAASL